MADVVRTDTPQRDVQYPTDFAHTSDTTKESGRGQTARPATTVNPSLNRSAEAVGRGLGSAVAGVRRLPQQLRSRIHLVGENAASKFAELRGAAETKAANLRDAAEVGLLELADKAAAYTSAAGTRRGSRMQRLRRVAMCRVDSLRYEARRGVAALTAWQPEDPLRVLLVGASAGFALGVILRAWRGNRG
ncbi:MAG TPA: hypothetical protein VKB58_09855 [Terriglobales bacterium]|jgi:hypothetical protein|nr:hypothetical protein [Terriglobales bacterium]